MPDFDLRIGIENELFLKGPGNVPDPLAERKIVESYANDELVPFYNKKRGRDLLRSKFSVGSHPGHEKDHTDYKRWTVTTDDTMGKLDLNENDRDVEGCTYSQSPRHIFTIRLTYTQAPSNLSLPYSTLALTVHGKKK